MVAWQSCLSNLSKKLFGYKRRRNRRSWRNHLQIRLFKRTGNWYHLALSNLQIPFCRPGIRHFRLLCNCRRIRYNGTIRRTACRSKEKRYVHHYGSGYQPLFWSTRMVPESTGRSGRRICRLFLFPQGKEWKSTKQLPFLLRRKMLGAGSGNGSVLPSYVRQRAAGS